jgi:natural product biosynthesis luciferase-like monooxygenase protein
MTASFNPAPLTAILMGDESLTIACGDMLLAGGHRIAAVVTRDAAVKGWAEGHGLRSLTKPREVIGAVEADWLLSIANLRMIPAEVLAVPARGAINFHDGPLPRYAGLNTPAWAILNGESMHGVSWHVIEGGVDEGDLLATREVEIAPDETAFSLNSKCYAAGMESFAAVLSQLEGGTLDRQPQDLSLRGYFARDDRPGTVLDFTRDAAALSALVRGLDFGGYWNPLGLPKLVFGGQMLRIGKLAVGAETSEAPGTVLAVGADHLSVATADRVVTLTGLTLLDAGRVDLPALTNVGEQIAASDMDSVPVTGEAFWRGALQRMDPVTVPLVGAGQGAPDWQETPLALPAGLRTAQIATAVGSALLAGAGMASGDLALCMPAETSSLVSPWVPLALPEAGTVTDLVGTVTERLSRAETGSFARDLPFRDPEISDAIPQAALSLSGTPLPGAALSVCLTGDAAKMIHDAKRLDPAAAKLIAARIEAALARFATAQTLDDLRALPEAETDTLLNRWNDTARAYDPVTIHAAFEAQVARTPDAIALVCEGDSLSYAALNARANRLAHLLRDRGVTPGTPVGLYVARGLDLLAGTLGILKAGGAYVPLDPGYPADRIAHYISDSATPVIVTQAALAASLPEHAAEVIEIDADARLASAAQENPAPAATPDDLAYLIYTSGSTGVPKGVMVTHGNVANFFAGMDDRIDHAAGSVWLAVTSLSFDISVLELFWTLSRGFKLVLAGDEQRTLVANGPVTGGGKHIDFNLFYWGNDDGVGPKKYELLVEGAKFADAHGFNAVWTPERHFHAFGGPYPNPSVTGAAVAAVTRNLAVRAGSCVAPLHHPARIAEEWAVIDNLTDGRVGLAIASGWQPDDFVLRPENTPPQNKPAMYAAIDTLRKLWAGEAVEFPTKDGTPFAVVTQPRPVSKVLPIWVTTAGNPQTWREAGEIGANVLTHLLGQSVSEVADKIRIYHDALRAAGHDPADHKVTVMLHTYLAETREEAEAVAREPMKDYLRSAAALIKQYAWAFPAFKKPQGATNPLDIDLEGLSGEEMDAILEFAFQRYFNDSGMFGTVADGLARTEELRRIGVDEVACLIDYGIPVDKVLAGLQPLAQVLAEANREVEMAEDDFSLAAQIVRHGVTHLQCTPSMAQMLVTNHDAAAALGRVKHLMVGGEALPGSLVRTLAARGVDRVQNMYGPTEATIWSTTQMIAGDCGDSAPVGTPISNTQVFILDDRMRPQPVGVPGELWIGGDGVTRGYWHREEMTEQRFPANPFGDGRLYRTGDLAAWDASGVLQFMGRADAQVKIRGHRIEPGEIEARLAALPGVTQAVVVARDEPGGAMLVGYVTATQPVDEAQARAALARDLPDIMVPAHIVTLDAMPLTPNKKIDRKALPRPERRRTPRAEAKETPVQGTQGRIAAIWSALLGVADIRGEDNFFALGGHSLLAVQAHRDIRANLGAERLSITDIFRFPTLEGLAAHLDKGGAPAAAPAAPEEPDRATADTMSKRRMMRAGRGRNGA